MKKLNEPPSIQASSQYGRRGNYESVVVYSLLPKKGSDQTVRKRPSPERPRQVDPIKSYTY